jgi:hypothetical protein
MRIPVDKGEAYQNLWKNQGIPDHLKMVRGFFFIIPGKQLVASGPCHLADVVAVPPVRQVRSMNFPAALGRRR